MGTTSASPRPGLRRGTGDRRRSARGMRKPLILLTAAVLLVDQCWAGQPLPTSPPSSCWWSPSYCPTNINKPSSAYTGTIPTEFGKLGDLTRINLQSNELSGTIPTQLGLCAKLEIGLWVDQNMLTSTIPTQLGGLVKSYYGMDLWSNQLIGTIPTQLGRLVKLTQYISFYGNSLTGWVPTELGNLEELGYGLWIGDNDITGSVPRFVVWECTARRSKSTSTDSWRPLLVLGPYTNTQQIFRAFYHGLPIPTTRVDFPPISSLPTHSPK
mmetsp:Transcript_96026/g.273773  ORF Transcript_96026/g.273773 Transcript_96026/m.273773 type:complete len:269 (+) Transcript_96026:136-942(+)